MLLLFAVLVVVRVGDQTVKIEIDDPKAQVFVDGDHVTIKNLGATIDLKPGEHNLEVRRGDTIVQTDKFEVLKGKNPILKISIAKAEEVADIENGPLPAPIPLVESPPDSKPAAPAKLPAGVIAIAGFNSFKGLNANRATNSPYPLGRSNVRGGADEPGWRGEWPADPKAKFVRDKVAEGDGALYLVGVTNYGRAWSVPQSSMFVVETSVRCPSDGGFGCYIWQTGPSTSGPNWRIVDGQISALDGDRRGGKGTWVFVAKLKPDVWHKVKLTIDVKKKSWRMKVDDAENDLEFGFRYNPASLHAVNFLVQSKKQVYIDAIRVLSESAEKPPAQSPNGIHHRVAEWVVNVGGAVSVYLSAENRTLWIRKPQDVPDQSFTVHNIQLQTGTDVSKADLQSISQLQSLVGASFPNCKIDDKGVQLIARCTGVIDLNLSGNPITDGGIGHLLALQSLQQLRVGGTQITDAGLKPLIGMPRLNLLSAENTGISDKGLEHTAEHPQLGHLNLSGTKITDAGLEQYLAKSKTLRFLNVSDTSITDAGLEALGNLPVLEHVTLKNTKVTQSGLAEFRKSHPACHVFANVSTN